jgi:predicted permease
VDEEIAFHLDMRVEELVAEGLDPERARAQARGEFGAVEEEAAALRGADRAMEGRRRLLRWLRDLGMDLHLALRRMRRAPGFTAAVVLTFALGIGTNAAMFGIVDRLLLRPPAHIAHPEQVKRLAAHFPATASREDRTNEVLSYADYEALASLPALSSVGGYWDREITLGRGEGAEEVKVTLVTGRYFSTLGTAPQRGRLLGPVDDREGAEGAAVISDGFWRRKFGADPDVIGKRLDFGAGASFTIVGVAPPGFTGAQLQSRDVWLPIRTMLYATGEEHWIESGNGSFFLQTVGRLRPGVQESEAAAEATVAYRRVHREQLERWNEEPPTFVLASLVTGRGPLASKVGSVAVWLAGVSLIVLVIACANIANLLLARAARQRGETAVRLALGSSRGRLVLQVVVESTLLALLGGAAALVLAGWGGGPLARVLLPEVGWDAPGARTRLVGAVLLLTLLAGLAAAVIPACQSSRPSLLEALKSGARSLSRPGMRLRSALTVLQAMLCVVLLVGSGLFVRSLRRVHALDLGIDTRGLSLVTPTFEKSAPDAEKKLFYARALERLRALPGVASAAYSAGVPFRTAQGMGISVPGLDSIPTQDGGVPYYYSVSDGYFSSVGLRVLHGRPFTDADREGATPVMVVGETMARLLWPGENAVGKCAKLGDDPTCTTVVGVVEDARRFQIVEESSMLLYLPIAQGRFRDVPGALLVRTRGGATGLDHEIQRELLALDPSVRFAVVEPVERILDPQLHTWRLGAVVFTAFGFLALLVAGIGLYSVLAFSVAQRTFELGVRSALGAGRPRLMGLVLGQAARLLALGVALGLVAAWLAAPRVEDLLYGTSPHDPAVLLSVAGVLLGVGLLAAWLPARRATRVDPSIALRAE